jgi:heme exporter protein CcmD
MAETVTGFLEMGGYGRFVWAAFAATVLVMAGLLIQSLHSLRERRSKLSALQTEIASARSSNPDEA